MKLDWEHKNYSKTTRSLWNCYRDEPNSGAVGNIKYTIRASESFDYKRRTTGRLESKTTEIEVEIVVLLKHLTNFWRILDMSLVISKISMTLIWSESRIITSNATRDANPDAGPAVATLNNPTNATCKIADT